MSTGPWVVRVISSGDGNNLVYIRGYGPKYVAMEGATFDASWYSTLGLATKVWKARGWAERWLKDRPGVQGVVEEDPRRAARDAYLAKKGMFKSAAPEYLPGVTFSKPDPSVFVYDDGGAEAAGYKPDAGDCVPRAIAIATRLDYATVLSGINAEAKRSRLKKHRKHARGGVYKPQTKRYMAALGWKWTPTMGIGTGCTVHLVARELPAGRLVVAVSKHLVAVIDGVIHDTYDPSRDGTRCVYGYWSAP